MCCEKIIIMIIILIMMMMMMMMMMTTTLHHALHPQADIEKLYFKRSEGGRGLMNLGFGLKGSFTPTISIRKILPA